MNRRAVIDAIAREVLRTELSQGKYLEGQGLFDPFENMTQDHYVMQYIAKNWDATLKTKFLRWYGSLQQRRLYNRMTQKDHSNSKVPVQLPGDYSIAALRVLGIDPWQL